MRPLSYTQSSETKTLGQGGIPYTQHKKETSLPPPSLCATCVVFSCTTCVYSLKYLLPKRRTKRGVRRKQTVQKFLMVIRYIDINCKHQAALLRRNAETHFAKLTSETTYCSSYTTLLFFQPTLEVCLQFET